MSHLSISKKDIEQDIWDWVINYIEVENKFYDYKFPPCPYARSARLRGLLDIVAFETGSIKQFINEQTHSLIKDKKFNTRVLVFPAKVRWYFHIHMHVQNLNKSIIPQNFYAQYGKAIKTQSRYQEWSKNSPYFIVIVNKLSDVLDAHQSLLKTSYYDLWTPKHYNDVVTRRQNLYEKYKKEIQ
jgi:hypothetical protein